MRDMVSTLMVSSVPVGVVHIVWPDAIRHLQRAIDAGRNRYRSVDLLDDILKSNVGLWMVMDGEKSVAAYTTRVIQYPSGVKGLMVDLLGGDGMDEWLPLVVDKLKLYASDMKCGHIELVGRNGWLRALKPLGWSGESVIASMELSDE